MATSKEKVGQEAAVSHTYSTLGLKLNGWPSTSSILKYKKEKKKHRYLEEKMRIKILLAGWFVVIYVTLTPIRGTGVEPKSRGEEPCL